jgi:hypothetical protein
MADFQFENHGSVVLVRPMTDAARDHAAEIDAQRLGDAIACEPRYMTGFVHSLMADGFTVSF